MTHEERAAQIDGLRELAQRSPADAFVLCHEIAAAIRDAVAAQRERDAKIAEQTHAELDAELSPEGCTDTGLEIARRIREATP